MNDVEPMEFRSKIIGWLVGVSGLGFLCYLLAPVLTPFLIAALLAYLANPAVLRLSQLKISRLPAVLLVFISMCVLAIALFLFFIPMVERQLSLLIMRLPELIDSLQLRVLPWLQQQFGVSAALDFEQLRQVLEDNWRQLGGTAATLVGSISRSGLALLALLANLVLIPVVTFYLMRDWDRLTESLRGLIPRDLAPQLLRIVDDCDAVLATFMRGQLLVMLSLGVIYSFGLWLVGIELALLIGMIAGVVSFVPYLGLIIGALVAGVASYIQFHDLTYILPIILVFGVGQLLEGFLLTPLLVGDRIGLHPVAVIFAVMAGGQLFGFFGILLALPVAAIIAVLLRFAHARYLDSPLYVSSDDAD